MNDCLDQCLKGTYINPEHTEAAQNTLIFQVIHTHKKMEFSILDDSVFLMSGQMNTNDDFYWDGYMSNDSGFCEENIQDLLHDTDELLDLGCFDEGDSSSLCESTDICDFSLANCKVEEFLRDFNPSRLEDALQSAENKDVQHSSDQNYQGYQISIQVLEDMYTASLNRPEEQRYGEATMFCHQMRQEIQQPYLQSPHEMKPHETYIELIVRAILSTPQMKMNLPEIYLWITDNYPYFHTAPKTWKNAVRHNLSMNEFFRKSGRAGNGRGSFWSIHPACVAAFQMGDYRRREARQRAMIADEEAKRQQLRNHMMSSSKVIEAMSPSICVDSQPNTSTPIRAHLNEHIAYSRV